MLPSQAFGEVEPIESRQRANEFRERVEIGIGMSRDQAENRLPIDIET